MKNLTKSNRQFKLSIHSIERLNERYNLNESQLSDAFNRSKMLNDGNHHKYPTMSGKFKRMKVEEPYSRLFVNPYYDIVFVVSNNVIVTVFYYDNAQYYINGKCVK